MKNRIEEILTASIPPRRKLMYLRYDAREAFDRGLDDLACVYKDAEELVGLTPEELEKCTNRPSSISHDHRVFYMNALKSTPQRLQILNK